MFKPVRPRPRRRGRSARRELDDQRHALAAPGCGWEDLSADEIRRRWPQWQLDDDIVGMYQDGGRNPRYAPRHSGARRASALARRRRSLTRPRCSDRRPAISQVTVTDRRRAVHRRVARPVCRARGCPSCSATWDSTGRSCSARSRSPISPRPTSATSRADRFPVWAWHGEEDVFYGLPVHEDGAVKAGRDMTGRFVTLRRGRTSPTPREAELTAAFLREHVAGRGRTCCRAKTCVYDMPPDRDFIVDLVPGTRASRWRAAPATPPSSRACSAASWPTSRSTAGRTYPIGAFAADRPALTRSGLHTELPASGGHQFRPPADVRSRPAPTAAPGPAPGAESERRACERPAPRCVSTVLRVTNSAWATCGLVIPPATISAIRRSDGVSASTPAAHHCVVGPRWP